MRAGAKGFPDLAFVPVRGCHTRGILVNTVIRTDITIESITALYKAYYNTHTFVYGSDEPLYLKQVVNTNYCYIHISKQGEQMLITSVIDNLLKGASGQAAVSYTHLDVYKRQGYGRCRMNSGLKGGCLSIGGFRLSNKGLRHNFHVVFRYWLGFDNS